MTNHNYVLDELAAMIDAAEPLRITLDEREFKALKEGDKLRHRIRLELPEDPQAHPLPAGVGAAPGFYPIVAGGLVALPILDGGIVEFCSADGERLTFAAVAPKVEKIPDADPAEALAEAWEWFNPPVSALCFDTSEQVHELGCWLGLQLTWEERYGEASVSANPWSVTFGIRSLETSPASN